MRHEPTQYWIDKARRAQEYYTYIYGWRSAPCGACNGSGYYDNTGSPPCGCCEGTGKERERGPKCRDGLFDEMCPDLALVVGRLDEGNTNAAQYSKDTRKRMAYRGRIA